ncbi:tonB family C-terminal domain protein [Collimonas pratensis]|uniref:TonB family C-terminal domain protein n=2 Tax=Collimonas pratensis TaxID=279113 RepID=A0ABN4MII6_9BURK|nr:tonB family C-terminal domain protein [Collimonas pratensis]
MQATMNMPFFFRFRDALATLPSALILAILIFAGIQKAVKIQPHVDDSLVQIALTEPEPPVTAPTPPAPVPLQEVKPQPVAKPTQQQSPRPSPPQAVTATPVSNTPNPEVAASTPPKAIAAPIAAPAPPQETPPPAPAAKPNNASIEASYISKLRAHLNSIKRYPTGREASQQRPQGKVKVWFVLNRDGTLVEQGIDESSNSMLLDEAARKTINRATFTAFPESSWAGEATHRFSAELEFIPGAG